MADIIEQLVRDQNTPSMAPNFEQSWADVYAYLYDPASNDLTPQQRLAQLETKIDLYNDNSPGLPPIVPPYMIDAQGNIDFTFTTAHDTNDAGTTTYFTFSDGSRYDVASNGTGVELTFTNNLGGQEHFLWNGSNYANSAGDSAEIADNGDLTFVLVSGMKITYAVNGDVTTTMSLGDGLQITTEQPDGTEIETIQHYPSGKDRSGSTDLSGSTIIKYPNGFRVTQIQGSDGQPTYLTFQGSTMMNGQFQSFNEVFQNHGGVWTDTLKNSVGAPSFNPANGSAEVYTADERQFIFDGESMIFSAYAPGARIPDAQVALGSVDPWTINTTPPPVVPLVPTATPQPPVLPG